MALPKFLRKRIENIRRAALSDAGCGMWISSDLPGRTARQAAERALAKSLLSLA